MKKIIFFACVAVNLIITLIIFSSQLYIDNLTAKLGDSTNTDQQTDPVAMTNTIVMSSMVVCDAIQNSQNKESRYDNYTNRLIMLAWSRHITENASYDSFLSDRPFDSERVKREIDVALKLMSKKNFIDEYQEYRAGVIKKFEKVVAKEYKIRKDIKTVKGIVFFFSLVLTLVGTLLAVLSFQSR